jgi:hypothetical protein
MGLRLSSEFPIGTTAHIPALGKAGLIVGHPFPYSLEVKIGPCEYLVSTSGVGTMSAERPYEDAPREVLEQQLIRQAAEIASMLAEAEGMATVVAAQMELIGDLQSTARPLPASGPIVPKEQSDDEWFLGLVDHLQTYLSQQCGSRAPLHIADVALRDLVSHILD